MTLLTTDECAAVHEATLRVLERTGVAVYSERGRRLLAAAGAKVEGESVRIPPELVAQSLAQAPRAVRIYNRVGELAMDLRDRNGYFGAGGTAPSYTDERLGVVQPFVLADCARLSRICDSCEHVSFDMAMGHCADVPVEVRDLCEVAVMIQHSPKPIVFAANTPDHVRVLAAIFGAARGGDTLTGKPYGVFYGEPISPLTHSPESVEKLWVAADAGFPIVYTSAPMAGATGPATLAGNIVVGNAECLSGIVMLQLYKPATPVIYGGVFASIDYRTMVMPYGAPELHLQTIACAEMGHYYQIPSFGTAGCADASTTDAQSGFEAGLSILLNCLAGANLIHDVAWMGSSATTSAEQLLLDDEMIAHCRRLLAGITVTEETLAVDLIDEVGQRGSFLSTNHTLKHFRRESFFPRLLDRRPMGKRAAHDPSLVERLGREVERRSREHQPIPMGDAELAAVDRILADHSAAVDLGKLWRSTGADAVL
jgi:trimethylamine--corrinoid protein Co-methyltransferase